MTKPNPIDEAVRVLRDESDLTNRWLAIASALESLRPASPPENAGTSEKEAVVPTVGVRFLPGFKNEPDPDAAERLGIDIPAWAAEIRRKVADALGEPPASPPENAGPSEEVGTISMDELIRISNERHMLRIERGELKSRAEAAEARAAESERALKVERETANEWLGKLHDAEKELSAERRAREGLELTIRGVLDEWRTGHAMHWDREGTHGANCPACKLDGDARHCLRKALEPSPLSGPVHAAKVTNENPTDEEVGRRMDAALKAHRWPVDVPEGTFRSSGGEATGHHWQFPGDACLDCGAHFDEAAARERCPGKKGTNEQRKDPIETAEASTAVDSPVHSGGVGHRVPGHPVSEPGGGAAVPGIAPPGLTQEEAEDVVTWYRHNRPSTFCDWGELNNEERVFHFDLYRFAHAEGFQAAKAKERP